MRFSLWIRSITTGIVIGCGIWHYALPLAANAIEFKLPRRGIPGRREGAGTRGPSCTPPNSTNLTVLLPQTSLGLTTAEYPEFFWFVPQTRAQSMKFSLFRGTLQEPTQQLIYENTLEVPAQPGIVSLKLPNTAQVPPLIMGQDYYWSVTLLCNPNEPAQNIQAEGWVQRIPIDFTLARQLATANPSDRPALYAQNGIWFDTLSTLATLRCTNATNSAPTQNWTNLLKSVGLDAIADQPLSRCRQ